VTSGARPPRDGEDPPEPSFAELAESLGRVRRIQGPRRVDAVPRARKPADRDRSASSEPTRFVFPVEGQLLLGRAPGFRARDLRRLRSGQLRPERVIDLHQLDRQAARRQLHESLLDAADSGCRCLLVIHGRGLRSSGARPVLKTLLPEWLAEAPVGRRVQAFAPAVAADGGAGATYVWLR
jgi:DNA-nicking Smr family endonuclease